MRCLDYTRRLSAHQLFVLAGSHRGGLKFEFTGMYGFGPAGRRQNCAAEGFLQISKGGTGNATGTATESPQTAFILRALHYACAPGMGCSRRLWCLGTWF